MYAEDDAVLCLEVKSRNQSLIIIHLYKMLRACAMK